MTDQKHYVHAMLKKTDFGSREVLSDACPSCYKGSKKTSSVEFNIATPRFGSVWVIFILTSICDLILPSVHFPGAVNSKFTTKLSFERPSTHSAIPTYRVIDSDGIVVDKTRNQLDTSNEEILRWYQNMLSGTTSSRDAES